jgi:hypothetical protein
LASTSQKSESAARPLATVSATRDGDIGPGFRNVAHTGFDHRNQPSTRFHTPRHVTRSSMQLHIGRDTPDGGTSNAVGVAE